MISTSEKQKIQNQLKNLVSPPTPQIHSGRTKNQRPPFHWVKINELKVDHLELDEIAKEINNRSKQFTHSLVAIQEHVFLKLSMTKRSTVSIEVGIGGPKRTGSESIGLIEGAFPGTDLNVSLKRDFNMSFTHSAAAVGIPAVLDNDEQSSWMTHLFHALQGAEFSLMLCAAPLEQEGILAGKKRLSQERDQFFQNKKFSISNGTSKMDQEGENKNDNSGFNIIIKSSGDSVGYNRSRSETVTKDESYEFESSDAACYIDLLDQQLDRYDAGQSIGMWQTAVYFATHDEGSLHKVAASISAVLHNEEGIHPFTFLRDEKVLELLNRCELPGDDSMQDLLRGELSKATSVITTDELTSWFMLPAVELPGYKISPVYDSFVNVYETDADIPLGSTLHRGKEINQIFSVTPEQLNKHALITGITGSGKTNTVYSLLDSFYLPFLIIEPTKQEYRHLSNKFASLQVYTLGNEQISPVRLNPFYFPEGVSLLTHIDSLKAVFTSSFSMYASMPNILEQCLYNIYMKKGWSLHHSTNIYAKTHKEAKEFFPTIKDLCEEVDEYLSKSGYAEEQKSNIRAALLTRLKSLMVGSKGLMLNTTECIDFAELLSTPTVLELEEVADDDDKALIMGVLFIRLAQQLKISCTDGQIDNELKHITIVEEAHRIFSNQEGKSESHETANIKGKAVEHFSNVLSEIRSMGEGMIIIDQVPKKLAPDAIKNTNLKIVHRIVSIDDAEHMAQALAMKPDQTEFFTKLKKGEAFVFQEGMDKPAHVKMFPVKSTQAFVHEDDILRAAKEYNAFVTSSPGIHPFAELMMEQDQYTLQKVVGVGKKLYHSLLFGRLHLIDSYIKNTEKQLLSIAYQNGFDVNEENRTHFLQSLMQLMIDRLMETDLFFAKIHRIRTVVNYFLQLLTKKPTYSWSEKEVQLLELRRKEMIYPLLEEATRRQLFEERTAQCLWNQPSPLNGQAYRIASHMMEDGIFEKGQVTSGQPAIDHLFQTVKRELQNYMIHPLMSSPSDATLLAKVLEVLTQGANKVNEIQFAFNSLIEKEIS
ncbi:MAG: ATP-binding protein [Firmicutes bacterium]|nr:ATP-binding protein [Bacillota bacterium]